MWQSPRSWMLLATLLSRGAGFVTTFALSRLAGVEALGTYSTVVNTASAVVAPFFSVLGNNATITAAEAHNCSRSARADAARASLAIALLLSMASFGLFAVVQGWVMPADGPLAHGWILVGAGSLIFGQALTAVVQGFYFGAGQFIAASRVLALVSIVVALGVAPVLWLADLEGALGLLVFASLGPAVVLAPNILRGGSPSIATAVWRDLWRRLLESWPSVAAATVNSGVNWYCAILLVQKVHGIGAVGIVAIAGQWLTLMLMPATSWGGVTLKGLKDAVASDDIQKLRSCIRSMFLKNLTVTLGVGAGIAACAWLIASAYGLRGTDLALLICLNGAVAIVAAINNVFERLLLCLGRQDLWLWVSLAAFAVQALVTTLLINEGLAAVPLGVLSAGLSLTLASWITAHRLLASSTGSRI